MIFTEGCEGRIRNIQTRVKLLPNPKKNVESSMCKNKIICYYVSIREKNIAQQIA